MKDPVIVTLVRRTFEVISIVLLLAMAVLVVAAVAFRYLGSALIWYDEVAVVLLAWLTFFGAALAATRRAHLGFSGLLYSLPMRMRLAVFALGEAVVYAFLAIFAYAGWRVLAVLGRETLVSVPIPMAWTQAIIPLGMLAFIVGQAVSTPAELLRLRRGVDAEREDIEAEIARHNDSGGTR